MKYVVKASNNFILLDNSKLVEYELSPNIDFQAIVDIAGNIRKKHTGYVYNFPTLEMVCSLASDYKDNKLVCIRDNRVFICQGVLDNRELLIGLANVSDKVVGVYITRSSNKEIIYRDIVKELELTQFLRKNILLNKGGTIVLDNMRFNILGDR